MLEQFRKLAQSKIGIPIIGLMILGMAAWGIEDIFSGGFGRKIIQAGDRSATEFQINRRLEIYMSNLRREDPGNTITRKKAAEEGLLDRVFNDERARLTRLGYARRLGADASAAAMLEDVNSIEAFKDPLTNEFDSQYYRNALRRIESSPEEYESDTQDRLTLGYLQDGITSALVTPSDLARIQAIVDGEVRYVSWFAVQKDDVPAPADPTDEQVQAFYDERRTAFEVPERRRLTLLELSGQDFLHQVEVTEENITEYYEATKFQRLAVKEERTFNEFIFQTEESAKAAFGILAIGGDYEPGETVQKSIRRTTAEAVAIEAIRVPLFTPGVEAGAVAGPVAANGAWIVGQLVEIHPGTPLTLEESRDTIIGELRAERAEIDYYAAVNRFDEFILEGLNLSQIAAAIGAPTISYVSVDARGLDENGAFQQSLTVVPEAFRQAFELSEGEFTDKFEQNDRTIVISVDKIEPRTTPAFEEIAERVKLAYSLSKEGEALKAAADAVVAVLDTGVATMAAQAERFGSTLETEERGLRRTAINRIVPRSVQEAAFAINEGKSFVVQGNTPTEVIIVRLDRIERPDTSELDVLAPIATPKVAEQLNEDLLIAFGNELQSAMNVQIKEGDYLAYRQRLIDDQ